MSDNKIKWTAGDLFWFPHPETNEPTQYQFRGREIECQALLATRLCDNRTVWFDSSRDWRPV